MTHSWTLQQRTEQLGTVILSRWRHWLNFIKANGAQPCAAKLALQRRRPYWQLHQLWNKFWVTRAFEVRWTCTCCHDKAGFNCYLLPLTYFSLFFVSLEALNILNAHSTLAYSQPQHQATSWWHDDVLVRFSHVHAQQQPFRTLRYLKNEAQQRENERKGKWEHECMRSFPGWLLPTVHGFFLAPEFNDRMSDHDEPMSLKAGSFEKRRRWWTMLQRRGARVQVGVTGKEKALTRDQRRSHSVSALHFSAIKLDQTGIQWRQQLNFTVPSCVCQQQSSFQYSGLNTICGWLR